MRKPVKRLAEILGVDPEAFDKLLQEARHPVFTRRQLDAVVDKLDEHYPFERVSIEYEAAEASRNDAEEFWHTVPAETTDRLSLAARAPVRKVLLRQLERRLGRPLAEHESAAFVDRYRMELFGCAVSASDMVCSLCGVRDHTVRACCSCGEAYCSDDGCVGRDNNTAWVANRVCKNCRDKLPKSWGGKS